MTKGPIFQEIWDKLPAERKARLEAITREVEIDYLTLQGLRRAADLTQAMYACLLLAVDCEDRAITTIEGIADDDEALTPVQGAFIAADAFQCGFCTADQIKSLQGLLTNTPNPTDEEILRTVTGNR